MRRSSANVPRRGRIATEGGDERAGVKSRPRTQTHRNARGARRGQGRARSSMTLSAASFAAHDAWLIGEPAVTRGASQWKVAKSTSVERGFVFGAFCYATKLIRMN
jgi:hypothetical protein